MSEKKDYLSMLADEVEVKKKKPASFSEEKFEKIERPKVNLNPKRFALGGAALVVLAVAAWFLFFSPKIEMPNFVGQKTSDVTAWLKQEGIKTSGIVIKEEYSFDVEEDKIIFQSVEAGKKISEEAKITFIASMGADPDEKVEFLEDVLSLTRSDIQEWVDENKLTGVKVSQSYSEEVEEGRVISFDLNGKDKEEFTRSTKVTFTVSRGPQPAGTAQVEDFTGKSQAEVETWAKSKKIVLEVNEVYSDEIASGLVVFQSVDKGRTLSEGEVFTISVSKGKAVTIPNFSTFTEDMLDVWMADKENNVSIIKKEIYSEKQKGAVISQSIAAGSKVDQGSVLELTISLARPILQNTSRQWLGEDYLTLHRWVDEAWEKGARIEIGNWLENTPTSEENPIPGAITSYVCLDKNGDELKSGCDGMIPVDGKIAYGKIDGDPYEKPKTTPEPVVIPDPVEVTITSADLSDASKIKNFCDTNKMNCNYEYSSEISVPVEVYGDDGWRYNADDKLLQGDVLKVVIKQ